MISKEIEIFKNIFNKRLDKIEELSKKNNFNDLKVIVNNSGLETDFSGLKDHVTFIDDIKRNKISIEEARYKQEQFDKSEEKEKAG